MQAIAQPTKGESIDFRTKETVTSQRFSVDYPDHWIVTQNYNDYIIIYNQRSSGVATANGTSPYLIKTDIAIQPHSLRDAILGIGNEPEDIQRIELVEINGQPGLRVWEESEGWDFPNTLITYVPIGDREIAYIVSFYSSENQAAEDAIIQMHNTLRVLD
ncbi:hypothetical protein IQ265_04960 [Nodosilinea sp. LEGE 06152]|uniref:PsbP-related protein n=1 Tax=Nodosilinea sp. LEGE 06152 TaxID=2777966 RepID=UPI00187DEE4F|nr:PsbP-related protein [Nodosilinea sp. LEGE 06152]MBE9156182.1 hypothetical protein [Nodosilinea sp. LEGE 06152]